MRYSGWQTDTVFVDTNSDSNCIIFTFKFFKIYLGFNEDPHSKCDKSDFFLIRKMRLAEFIGLDPTFKNQEIGNIGGLWKIWA